jgi:hydroxyethylthiazole kinase-like uncharacterized protein yjeF
MKILSGKQTREADAYTIAHEPVASADLMERAALAFFNCFIKLYNPQKHVQVFCGPGNNGGDGLAIARILAEKKYHVSVYILEIGGKFSPDFMVNQERLSHLPEVAVIYLKQGFKAPKIEKNSVVIDAVFGSGLSRPVTGIAAEVIDAINLSGAAVVAVDIPSGLYADLENQPGDCIVKADKTLSFHLPKLSFFFCSNAKYTGDWEILDIGLDASFIKGAITKHHYIDLQLATGILKKRERCGHKGTYGHALIWAGSYGKTGAARLCAHACMNAGAGLTTAYIPAHAYDIFQAALPEVMVTTGTGENELTGFPDISKYSSVAIGPGIGIAPKTAAALSGLLKAAKDTPVVIDADALNIISENKEWLHNLPKDSVLTPHPKEFERLAGPSETDWERQGLATDFAKKYKCVLVLKGAYTSINLPDGTVYFNATGNPGMAKGGSGDVLTGIITGLLAQKYTVAEAAILGVYLHGRAGDIAAAEKGEWSMGARDLIEGLGKAFLLIM